VKVRRLNLLDHRQSQRSKEPFPRAAQRQYQLLKTQTPTPGMLDENFIILKKGNGSGIGSCEKYVLWSDYFGKSAPYRHATTSPGASATARVACVALERVADRDCHTC
jgi:hypothetical protein